MAGRFLSIAMIMLLGLASTRTAQGEISLHTRFITPRLHLLEPTSDSLKSQSAYYSMELDFSHDWSSALRLNGALEFGPRDFYYSDQLRIKQLFVQYHSGNWACQVGRFPYWNVLFPVRIDGLLFSLNKWGKWTLMGGLPVFYQRPTKNYNLWYLQWRSSRHLKLAVWQTPLAGEQQLLAGLSTRWAWSPSLLAVGELSWNFSHQQLDRLRLYLSKSLAKGRLLLTVRKVGQTMAVYYPWLTDAISPPPVVNCYWIKNSPLRPALSLGYRFSQLDSWFTTFSVGRGVRASLGLYQHADRQWITGSLSTHKQWKTVSVNLKLTANGVEYGGDLEPAEAFGVNAWLSWHPFRHTLLQLNGSYVQNPFYRQDGRLGVDFSYEL